METARFCAANNLHLVSNEIYAKSVFDAKRPGIPAFSSILSLDLEGIIDPTLVHVVYGASKDFCANGLRLGILQTRNVGLLESVARLGELKYLCSAVLFDHSHLVISPLLLDTLPGPGLMGQHAGRCELPCQLLREEL